MEQLYYSCPAEIGSREEFTLTAAGIVSLEKTTAGLCTLARVTDTGVLPVAKTYNANDWERAGGTYAATLQDITCDTNGTLCEMFLLSGTYELFHRSNAIALTDKESMARFLEVASFGARPQDLQAADDFDPIEYVRTHIYDIPATYHREFYRRRANPHWRFHKREFAANLDPCTQDRDTTWRANVMSAKDSFSNIHVKPWNEYWEVSIDKHVRTVVPRLRLSEDESQLEGTYDLCASYGDIRRGVYRVLLRGKCRKIVSEDLYLNFPNGYSPVNTMTGELPSLSDSSAWQSSSTYLPHYILKTRVPTNNCASLLEFSAWGPPVFAKTASGEWMQFDPRIIMHDNTPDSPLLDGGATSWFNNHTSKCAAVKRHVLNEASCVMSEEPSCIPGSDKKDLVQTGLVVCGSPNEVANDPTLGDSWIDIPSITTPSLSMYLKVPRDTTGAELLSKQKGFVWNTIAVTSDDQLVSIHHFILELVLTLCIVEATRCMGVTANFCVAR